MRAVFIVLLSIFMHMETFPQNKTIDRQPVANGRFYSADKTTLSNDISKLFKSCKISPEDQVVRAIISPHAGYVFSGKTAAAAYATIPRETTYKNIFIIGSSHVMAFAGASVYNSGDYITPMGKLTVNKEIASRLIKENKSFKFPENAHLQEHSIEVQLPFIQYHFKRTPLIVPIIIGTNNKSTVKQIAEALRPWFTNENLFVISSDFSHYPSYNDAIEVDNSTALSFISGNPQTFLSTLKSNSSKNIPGLATSMCGWTAGLTLLYLIEGNNQLEIKHIDYCNSGDSSYGGKGEVVGYHAITITGINQNIDNKQKPEEEFSINEDEKKLLFEIARNSIQAKFNNTKDISFENKTIPEKLERHLGAFVTLKINGVLRGCIGRIISTDPLYKVVQLSALSSAFEDPRFLPITKDEFNLSEIEITVLGPLKKISDINEIVSGKHGIYIKKDFKSGTMLPQVATEHGWSTEEFLGYTSRDKAGLGWDGWKNADIFIYEGVVLEENQK